MNKQAIFKVFTDADNSTLSFAERLLALGVADKATAKPLAMEWAIAKHPTATKEGLRGVTFVERNTAAEQAMYRVLAVCFPSADKPSPQASNKTESDEVAKLLKKYAALTAAEKRRFKNLLK
jgi:hypothetical protein